MTKKHEEKPFMDGWMFIKKQLIIFFDYFLGK